MADEINFLDLISLKRITDTTVVEKFGGLINSSFFDASNILGTLKLKGLIDFTTAVPGQNAIKLTDQGKLLVSEAAEKAKMQFDPLDLSILTQLSSGKRTLNDLHSATNIAPHDLAMHLNKLVEQQFANADMRNGVVSITLTEKGFMQVKAGMPKPPEPPKPAVQIPPTAPPPMPASAPAPGQPIGMQPPAQQQMPAQQPPPPAQPQPPPASPQNDNISELERELKTAKGKKTKKVSIAVIIIIIIIALFVLLQRGII